MVAVGGGAVACVTLRAEACCLCWRAQGLTKCAGTLIGDESLGLKGISGGEKRRLSVGLELIKDPALIFLDEPTTGAHDQPGDRLVTGW